MLNMDQAELIQNCSPDLNGFCAFASVFNEELNVVCALTYLGRDWRYELTLWHLNVPDNYYDMLVIWNESTYHILGFTGLVLTTEDCTRNATRACLPVVIEGAVLAAKFSANKEMLALAINDKIRIFKICGNNYIVEQCPIPIAENTTVRALLFSEDNQFLFFISSRCVIGKMKIS